jgi:hydrogenase expression/formation protein HypC
MCLAVPGKIVSIEDTLAEVDLAGTVRKASLLLVPDAGIGDYVLIHAGFAIQVLDEDYALETLELLEAVDEISG